MWSETILGELRRNVVADNPDVDPDRFSDHTLAEMRRHFPAAMVSVGPDDIDRFDNDPKDRHVAAVAVVAAADAVVTINVKDFRSRVLDESGIAIQTPGGLIELVLDEAPELVEQAVRRIANRWTNPPRTPAEVADHLARHPTMASAMDRARPMLS